MEGRQERLEGMLGQLECCEKALQASLTMDKWHLLAQLGSLNLHVLPVASLLVSHGDVILLMPDLHVPDLPLHPVRITWRPSALRSPGSTLWPQRVRDS